MSVLLVHCYIRAYAAWGLHILPLQCFTATAARPGIARCPDTLMIIAFISPW